MKLPAAMLACASVAGCAGTPPEPAHVVARPATVQPVWTAESGVTSTNCRGEVRTEESAVAYAGVAIEMGPPTCEVTMTEGSIEVITVAANGGSSFPIAVERARIVAYPNTTGAESVPVQILAPLRFNGVAKIASFAIAAPTTVAAGVLRLGAGDAARATHVRATGTKVIADVAFDLGREVAPSVAIDCSSLAVREPAFPPPEETTPTDEPLFVSKDGPLRLFAAAGATDATSVDGELGFRRVATKGGFVELEASFADGATIRGWSPREKVVVQKWGDRVGYAFAPCGPVCRAPAVPGADYEGDAVLERGAPISAEPGGAAWATVPEPLVVEVAHRPGDDFVRVVKVPGVTSDPDCDAILHAFAPLHDVKLLSRR